MINYFYYKIYKSYTKKNVPDIPQLYTATVLTVMLFLNIVSLNGFLAKLNFVPFLFSNKLYSFALTIIFLVVVMLYYKKSKRDLIFYKYSNENRKECKQGNIAVNSYIFLTMLVFFAVGFFKPGYLPSI